MSLCHCPNCREKECSSFGSRDYPECVREAGDLARRALPPGAGPGRFSNMECRLGGSGGYIVFVDAEMPKHCHRRNA